MVFPIIGSNLAKAEEYVRGWLPWPINGVSGPVLVWALAAAGACTARCVYTTIYTCSQKSANTKKRARKQEQCKKSFDDLAARLHKHPVKPAEVKRITSMALHELVGHLKARTLRPIDALRAYQTKALEAHRRTNCLVEVISEAEEWALALEEGPRDGLMFGVPISIKDDVGIKGYDSTLGCVEKINRPWGDDSCILKVIRGKHGAIPFVKTNMPQTGLSFEPGNPIHGSVANPHMLERSPGGSSSGEGALIGSGASVLGIGSDIGGSIRIPAHLCGVCGFKPTSQRTSLQGNSQAPLFKSAVVPAWGPLARDVDSLVLAMKALWDGTAPLNELDPAVVPIPFNNLAYEDRAKLKIGYYVDDGDFRVFPGCARAVEVAKRGLEAKGHELVEWRPPEVQRGLQLYTQVLAADGNRHFLNTLKYDEVSPAIRLIVDAMRIPVVVKWLLSKLLWPFMPKEATYLGYMMGMSDVAGYWNLAQEVDRYVERVHFSWKDNQLDAVICPPYGLAAPPLGEHLLIMAGGTYSALYNLLNFPAGVVRMTKVTQQDIGKLEDCDDRSRLNWVHAAMKKAMGSTKGLPMGVMVVAMRYHDEICLRVMREAESAAEFSVI